MFLRVDIVFWNIDWLWCCLSENFDVFLCVYFCSGIGVDSGKGIVKDGDKYS